MNKHICIDCESSSRRKHSPLCQKCFDKEMKFRILNEDRVVESPDKSWF